MILGIDTSCYTTSLALVDRGGNLISEKRKILTVPLGKRGLMQSEAVFQHVQNLPLLFSDLHEQTGLRGLKGVCVSTRPRPVAGSYMPVFTVCQSFGQVIAHSKQIPLYLTSHQEGHLMAGIYSAGGPREEEFLAMHLSGGTSELLKVAQKGKGFSIEILGGTGDLHAGQFIDRIGVTLGLSFPAGAHLEKLAATYQGEIPYLSSGVKGYEFSFSGPETGARNLLAKNVDRAGVARAVEHCVATTLEKVLRKAIVETKINEVLLVGGVAANLYLKQRLIKRLTNPAVGGKLYFAPPKYAVDNALGVALIGKMMLNG